MDQLTKQPINMKRIILFLSALLFVVASYSQVQNSDLTKGLIFHAPLDQWKTQPGAELSSGTITSGARYTIGVYVAGDDFTNVGASSNASGVTFVATGTTPTTWTNGSILRQQNYYTTDLISGIKGTNTDVYNVLGSGEEGRRSLVYAGAGSSTIADADRYDVGTGDFSISMKIKPANITDNGKYLVNKEDGGVGYGIYQEDNDLWIRFNDGTTDVSAIIGTDVLAANTELEFSIVFSRAGNATLYTNRNNTPVGTVAISTAALTLSNAGAIVVGNATAGSAGFSGEIFMCRMFNFALTSTQAVNYMKTEYPIEYAHIGATNAEMITNGGFDSDANWGTHTYWTISGGTANYLDNGSGYLDQSQSLTYGSQYYLNLDVTTGTARLTLTDQTASTIGSGIGGSYINIPTGHYAEVLTITTSAIMTSLRIYSITAAISTFSIDNFSLIKLGCVLNLNAEGINYATNIWQDRLNSLSATVSGATVSIPPSSELGAMRFNGTTSDVNMGDADIFTLPNTNFSISFWCFDTNISEIRSFFGKQETAQTREYSLRSATSGALQLYLFDSGSGTNYTVYTSTTGAIQINTWQHVCITFSSGTCNFYINGSLLNSTAGTNTGSGFSVFPNTSSPLRLGLTKATNYYFHGILDDIRFYKNKLSQEEITLLYQSGH